MPTILPDQLERFAISLIAAGGATPHEADVVGKSLVRANLYGYESHGVMRIPFYIQALKDGEVVSKAPLAVLNESPTRIVTDANWGFGQTQAQVTIFRHIEDIPTSQAAQDIGPEVIGGAAEWQAEPGPLQAGLGHVKPEGVLDREPAGQQVLLGIVKSKSRLNAGQRCPMIGERENRLFQL